MTKLSELYTKDEIILAIGRNRGIKTAMCRELGCTVHQLDKYLQIHTDLLVMISDAKKELVGLAEETVLNNLSSDNPAVSQKAAEFLLKTIGRDTYGDTPQTLIQLQCEKDVEVKQIFGV